VAINEAIKDGKGIASILPKIDDIEKESLVSLERFYRTKTTELFNRGRVSFFDSTGIVEAYQYSAILDDRTTVICAGLHGKIFKAGEQPIPPLHFNCRSVVVPITRFEDFKVDKSVGGEVKVGGRNADRTKENFPRTGGTIKIKNQSIDKFIEENKGEGFSGQ
jgi:SPP1 gp7 family putative phage head morphogenesis protein